MGFAALSVISVVIFSLILTAILRTEQQNSYENEVRSQAREVADYMAHLEAISFVRSNTTMQYVIRRKIESIRENYNADIWIVSFSSGTVEYIDSYWNTGEEIATDAVWEQLSRIFQGDEITVKGLFDTLDKNIVTIGVPWFYSDGRVVGAVMLHIPGDKLRIDFMSVLIKILPVGALVLLLGLLLSYFLARSQSKPIKVISTAVNAFASGDLKSRVDLTCGGELQELGDSINEMTQALSELEESRRSFVANVSHELRSPLTSMRGYIDGMLDGTIPPENAQKYLAVVRDETNRLTGLVNDLLNLSRMESGRFPLEKSDFDLCEQLRRVIIGFEKRIDEKNIEVDVQMPDEALMVNADCNRISQVLTNLIDNALKFMPESGGLLTLRLESVNGKAVCTVKDNGCGISKEDLPHIFDRFYKVDKAHTSGQGTGLGLAIVKNIIEQHGQTVKAVSDENGTEFTFTLDIA